MSLIHPEQKILSKGDILSLAFQHGNNSHAIIVTDGDVVATPQANRVIVKIDPQATHAYALMDNKGHYTCVFPSAKIYQELVRF